MDEAVAPARSRSDAVIDALAWALFAVFVGVLFLGFEDASFPYATVGAVFLVGSLAVLFWGNLRAHRVARSVSSGERR